MDFYFAARAFPLLFPLCLMPPDQGQLARPARTIRRAFKAPTTWLPSQSARASTVPQNRPKPDPPTGYPPKSVDGTYASPTYDFAQPIHGVGDTPRQPPSSLHLVTRHPPKPSKIALGQTPLPRHTPISSDGTYASPTYGFARSIRCAGDGVGSWELSGLGLCSCV